jgi:2-iminobutanoate/2-iminopropanoate deaminase
LSKVVKATVYLTDLNDREEMNQVYSRFFSDTPPARAAVEVSRLVLGARLEIEVVALV